MNHLLVYVGKGITFAQASVADALRAIPGATDIEERNGTGWIIQAQVTAHGDRTIVRLVDDRETISISGTDAASLSAIVELLPHFGPDLRLVDTDYTFDVSLRGVTTIEELQARIDEGRAAAQTSNQG